METKIQNMTAHYFNPELEGELEKTHQSISEDVTLKAKHFAKSNKPEVKGDNLLFYVGEDLARYDALSELVKQKVRAENTSIDIQMLTDAADDKTGKLQEKRKVVKKELQNMEYELDKKGIKLDSIPEAVEPKSKKQFMALLGCILVTETFFNAGAIQMLSENLLFSIVIAIGITGGLFMLARLLAQYLRENTAAGRKKALITGGVALLALSIFYFLAQLRAEYVKEQSNIQISPILLVAVNVLFFTVTCWQYFRNAVSPEEQRQYEAKKKMRDELLKYKNQLDELKKQDTDMEQEIERLVQDTAEQTRMILHKPGYVKVLTGRIVKWKIEAVETFKAVNLAHRSDGTPDCFFQSTEPADHYYQTDKNTLS